TVAYTVIPSSTGATFTGTDEGAAWTGTVSLSGTWDQTPFSRLGNAQSTLEFNGLTGWCSAGEHTFKTVRLSGNGLTINNGISDAVTTFTATLEGNGPITMSKPQGAPTYTLRFAGDCSAYAGAVTVATTSGNKHSVCFGASVARKDGTIQVGSDARVQIANGKTWTAISGTEVSGTIGGTGTVSGTLTFNSGATLDASAGTLTAGTVAVADGATVTVTLPEDAAAGKTVLTCTSPATVAEKLIGAPEGLKFAANKADTAVVLAIVIPPVAEVELSESSQAVLLAKAEAAGLPSVTAVTGSTTVEGRPTTLTAAQIDAALAVFGDSIVTADGTYKTLKVDYNFGIVSITPSYDATGAVTMFTVTVAVKTSDGNAVTLAEGATIELVDNDTNTTLRAAAPFSANGSGGYDGYFYATSTDDYDSPIGRSFKVKATK
ncbi:MAG: hypothetical protein ACI4W7_00340, partial [Candidatus Spyradenecus sp.]